MCTSRRIPDHPKRHGQSAREAYLDRVRGIAVLIMIEAHLLDSWTRTADRVRPAYGVAMLIAGFGAPLFLFLAGVSLIFSFESKVRKSGDPAAAWSAVRRRGWQIFGLAFLFRLQSFVLTAGYSASDLLKVDILNVMGPAIVLAGALGSLTNGRRTRAVIFLAAAIATAMLTPIVRTASIGWLPDPIEWYVRPRPMRTTFTMFPWAGFLFAGSVTGVAVERLRRMLRPGAVQTAVAAVSVLTALGAWEASFLPSIYGRSEFWTSSPTFFFLRAGLISATLPVAYFWERAPWRGLLSRWSPVETLGRSSLFVYWIHVEMVYGVVSRPFRRALTLDTALVAYAAFSAFLLALVLLKNRIVAVRHGEPRLASEPTRASI